MECDLARIAGVLADEHAADWAGVVVNATIALATLFAVGAARSSAEVAKSAQFDARRIILMSLRRDAVEALHQVVAESLRIDAFGNHVRGTYQTLTIVDETPGMPADDQFLDAVERCQREAADAAQWARTTIEKSGALESLTEDEWHIAAVDARTRVTHLQRVRDMLERDLEALDKKLDAHRRSTA